MLTRLLRERLRPHARSVVLLALFQMAQAAAALSLPTLNATVIDDGVLKGDSAHILRTGAVMAGMTLLQMLFAVGAVFLAARTAMALGHELRSAVFGRVLEWSGRELARFGAPSLLTRTTNDVQQIQVLVLMMFTTLTFAPLVALGGIVLAVRLNPRLSTLLPAMVPALGLTMGLILHRLGPRFRTMQQRLDRVNRVLREQITGIRVVRAFVREEREHERFRLANAELFEVSARTGRLLAMMFPAAMLIINLSSVAVIWVGGHLVADGSAQIGTIVAFINYLALILGSAVLATFTVLMVPRASVSAERIAEVLDTASSLSTPDRPVTVPRAPGRLELRGAGFAYPGAAEPVLHGVDLVAVPGEVVAVIGSTGSGKSTLLGLVPRLYDATTGAVLVGGIDVRDLAPATLAATVGLVPQTAHLFSGTVASNLRYGRPDATDAELWHVLGIAQARDFVAALPGGLDAPVGQGGAGLSGGQRQRLAIARALAARPRIYLFDDSFSALDGATEAALRAALAGETGDATVVMVTQRVPTARQADRIVVLDEGRVVGTGTHEELMAAGRANRTYREIVLSQLTEREAA